MNLIMFEDEEKIFYENHNYKLNLEHPRSLNEKIVCKKLYDRNPLIPLTTDKLQVRQYIVEKMEEKNLIPLIGVYIRPEEIDFDSLPEEYIIKPNHGCGWYIIKKDGVYTANYEKRIIEEDKIIPMCNKWISSVYGIKRYEWAYSQIKPLILIEKLLKNRDGNIPKDYRFWMFNGKCKLITVTTNRMDGISFTYYSNKWKPLDFGSMLLENKPALFDEALDSAEKLSEDFDFVQIDFYLTDRIYFGEIVHYPGSGDAPFPKKFDFKMGKYWICL